MAGGTGFLGNKLGQLLVSSGHKVWCLARDIRSAEKKVTYPCELISWDGHSVISSSKINSIHAVFNFAGAGIADCRWSPARKRELRSSRIETTKNLVQSLSRSPHLKFFLNVSAVGIYGDRGDEELTERSEHSQDFLSKLCEDWEREALVLQAQNSKVRVVIARLGVVLSRGEGFLKRLEPIFRWGLGGPLGDGSQFVSWIHIEDLLQFCIHSMNMDSFEGVYNLCAPYPLRNRELSKDLGYAIRRPAVIPVPRVVLKSIFGEMSEVLMSSQKVFPERLSESGFEFKFETFSDALKNIY